MRTIEEIEQDIITVIKKNGKATIKELIVELKISPKLLTKILDKMVLEGTLDENL